jgi:hypothetical protein
MHSKLVAGPQNTMSLSIQTRRMFISSPQWLYRKVTVAVMAAADSQ